MKLFHEDGAKYCSSRKNKKNISKSSKFTIFDNAKTSAKIISFEYFGEVKRNLSLNSAF